ncbi:hypothetical protein BGP_4034 [Beggiatoa sp. PS]|nr:hypothetical protein BGP_4034 [Beggiatoa sp. PS]
MRSYIHFDIPVNCELLVDVTHILFQQESKFQQIWYGKFSGDKNAKNLIKPISDLLFLIRCTYYVFRKSFKHLLDR